MRFKSKSVDKYCIYAVSGVNSVSFAIDYTKANTKGLLGFAVKRTYPGNGEHFLPGFKLFEKDFNAKTHSKNDVVSTEDSPVQSFVWDDFTLKAGQEYTYTFFPMTGKPGALIKGKPIPITIKTEPSFSTLKHDIFFNRGVASSQAYAREFGNVSPDKLVGKKQQDAFDWLGRDLFPALLKFIGQAKKGDTILGCFYEFNYLPVLQALKDAMTKGVDVQLIVDAKKNNKGKKDSGTPRDASLAKIKEAKIPMKNVKKREANKDKIQHNKFMVYLKGKSKKPTEVWTGSTNITESGIFGQTNVGHWVRDEKVAALYEKYWQVLHKDPGAKDGDTAAKKKAGQAAYKKQIMAIQDDIKDVPKGITPIFSPRAGLGMLNRYFGLVDEAQETAAITLAFGITATLKDMLIKHDKDSPLTFMMLEKQDKVNPRSTKEFVPLTFANNVYEAFGAFLQNPVYEFVKETNMKQLGITNFVNYIHSKFLIQDALGDDPVVITGSANFSPPSTTDNDENMIVIRGDKRVADIYFTEFNRLFNHYYFRAVVQELKDKKKKNDSKSFFLCDNDSWIGGYKPGSFRHKRVDMFVKMKGAKTL